MWVLYGLYGCLRRNVLAVVSAMSVRVCIGDLDGDGSIPGVMPTKGKEAGTNERTMDVARNNSGLTRDPPGHQPQHREGGRQTDRQTDPLSKEVQAINSKLKHCTTTVHAHTTFGFGASLRVHARVRQYQPV